VNPKKCSVLVIKNHCKLSEEIYLKGIPIFTEYCCQIVVINNLGSIAPQVDYIKSHSNYLRANRQYYMKDLSFENQYLILIIYMRQYFLYIAPVILLKHKLKLCKRASTTYILTSSSKSWDYRPTCLARRQRTFSILKTRNVQ
jgi:hypothetical protein